MTTTSTVDEPTTDDLGAIDVDREFAQSFSGYKNSFTFSHGIRQKLATKLVNIVDTMVVDPGAEKASMLDAKRGYIESTLGLLKDMDQQHLNDLKVREKMLARKQSEQAADLGNAIVTLLSSITARGVVKSTGQPADIDQMVRDAVDKNDDIAPIMDGEVIMHEAGFNAEELNAQAVM